MTEEFISRAGDRSLLEKVMKRLLHASLTADGISIKSISINNIKVCDLYKEFKEGGLCRQISVKVADDGDDNDYYVGVMKNLIEVKRRNNYCTFIYEEDDDGDIDYVLIYYRGKTYTIDLDEDDEANVTIEIETQRFHSNFYRRFLFNLFNTHCSDQYHDHDDDDEDDD